VTDPTYTSIEIIPINSKENGSCSLCGAFVLDYSLHTNFHRELVEAFAAYASAWAGQNPWAGMQIPPPPVINPPKGIDHA
jgi:hypothetical protein